MAATHLAVVTEDQITVYDDALYKSANVIKRIPLGSGARGTAGYTATLELYGWKVIGAWSGTSTDRGPCPSVAVRKV